MISKSTILRNLPAVIGLSYVEKENAGNNDIISALVKNYPAAVSQIANSPGVANSFRGKNARQTAFNIWNFLRANVKYEIDKKGYQFIQMPNALLSSGRGDCKSLSLFAAACLDALGMPVAFRFVSFQFLNPIPSHVFVITEDEKGKEIILDAVWPKFDSTKNYFYKKDKTMKVVTLSGVGSVECSDEIRYHRNELYKLLETLPYSSPDRIRVMRRLNEINEICNENVSGIVSKIALAPGRNAYYALVRLNVRGIAQRLDAAISKDSAPVRELWERLGGKFKNLQDAVKAGKTKNPLFGAGSSAPGAFSEVPENPILFNSLDEANAARAKYKISGIGEAVSVAALLAAAAPVIATVGALLGKVFGASQTDTDLLNDAAAAGGNASVYDSSLSVSDSENDTFIPGITNIVTIGALALLVAKLTKLI